MRAGLSGFQETQPQISLGLSVFTEKFGVDYAYSTHELGALHRVALGAKFGGLPGDIAVEGPQKSLLPPAGSPVVDAPSAIPPGSASPLVGSMVGSRQRDVVVAPFEARSVSMQDAGMASDWLQDELKTSGRFNLPKDSALDALAGKSDEYRQAMRKGCSTDECGLSVGKALGCEWVIVGSFGKFLDSYVLTMRVLDVESGKELARERVKAGGVEGIEQGVKNFVAALLAIR